MEIKVFLEENTKMPTKAYEYDAGFDLYSRDEQLIKAHSSAKFDTGVHIEIPKGYVGFLKSRSGWNVKFGIQSEGVIDSGYEGSIVVKLYNHSNEDVIVRVGDRISQIVILPIPEVKLIETKCLKNSERGINGFGSSGR